MLADLEQAKGTTQGNRQGNNPREQARETAEEAAGPGRKPAHNRKHGAIITGNTAGAGQRSDESRGKKGERRGEGKVKWCMQHARHDRSEGLGLLVEFGPIGLFRGLAIGL